MLPTSTKRPGSLSGRHLQLHIRPPTWITCLDLCLYRFFYQQLASTFRHDAPGPNDAATEAAAPIRTKRGRRRGPAPDN